MCEGAFTGGNFASIASREHIEVATIDGVAEDEIGGGNADVCGDIGGDLPDAGADGGLAIHGANLTIPGDEAGEVAICIAVALVALDGVGECGLRKKKRKY